jgi:dTDP-glucose 4,6-dehydratase
MLEWSLSGLAARRRCIVTRTVLVTGGAGFIGSNLVHRLHEAGDEVVVLDALTYAGNLENLADLEGRERYRFVHGDLCDAELVRACLERHLPEAIFHLAAESHVDRSIEAPRAFVRTNVAGTLELLEAARRVWGAQGAAFREAFRFVHVSTDEVYGSLGAEGLFTEESPYRPNSPYAASKAGADHLARAAHRTYGLPVVTTNASNNYGPYQFPEKLIPLVTLNALEGRPLPVYGEGKNVRDWLFVGDHCEALESAAERGAPGRTYLVGGRCERTTLEMVGSVCDALDAAAPAAANAEAQARRPGLRSYRELIALVEDRPGHDLRYAIDPSRIRTELGWSARTPFAEGIRATVGWYLGHREWCARISARTYARERLGLLEVREGGR